MSRSALAPLDGSAVHPRVRPIAGTVVRRAAVSVLLLGDRDDEAATPGAPAGLTPPPPPATPTPPAAPADPAPPAAARPALRRVLLPLDGSALAEEAAGVARAVGVPGETTFVLLRVVPVPASALPPAQTFWTPQEEARLQQERADAAAYLAGVAARLRAAGFASEVVVALERDVADAILREAEARAVDLVAIGTRGRGGVARLLLGSVADRVVRGATRPTLVVPPSRPGLAAATGGRRGTPGDGGGAPSTARSWLPPLGVSTRPSATPSPSRMPRVRPTVAGLTTVRLTAALALAGAAAARRPAP
ncbi:MAG TPA: universal stress protein, partial [Gemmatimonadaceae bacterium]|nr:universal stress protein [Gemmatimonadaceae bacterium]